MKNSVEAKIKEIIIEHFGVDEGEVVPSASFVDDLGADSLDTIELVMALEEAFDIEIHDEDAERVRTVQQAIDVVKSAMGSRYQSSSRVPVSTLLTPIGSRGSLASLCSLHTLGS